VINICYFIGSFNIGGAENLIFQIIKNLDKKKYKVFVGAFTKNGDLYKEYQKLGVEIVIFPQKRNKLNSAYKFARFLKQNQIQCIHIHLTGTFLFSVTVAKLMRVPNIIIHWHNVYFYLEKSISNLTQNVLIWVILKYSALMAHSIVAISDKVKSQNCKNFHINKKKVNVIYNAIDFSLIPNSKHIPSANNLVLGSIGKVTDQKGYDILIPAFNIVHKKHPNCKLEIVGAINTNGNQQYCNDLFKMVKTLELEDPVVFTDGIPYEEVYERLFTWSIFVLASKWEGFGLVLVEAMASGTPVIASNVDAIPEIIDDGRTGLLFQVNNPADLAEKILKLIKDQELSNQLVENASKEIDRFSISKMVNELDGLYHKAI
jgi:glycosyltransferase involved in cell wall biosynthesis